MDKSGTAKTPSLGAPKTPSLVNTPSEKSAKSPTTSGFTPILNIVARIRSDEGLSRINMVSDQLIDSLCNCIFLSGHLCVIPFIGARRVGYKGPIVCIAISSSFLDWY